MMQTVVLAWAVASIVTALVASPLLVGIVNRTKAVFAGRHGQSVFQLYFDIAKLVRKSSPRSTSSTWVFDLAPVISLVSTLSGGLLVLLAIFMQRFDCFAAAFPATLFSGFYFLGSARFWTVLGARDVASAFPDMGSAREVQFSALAEAVLFAVLGFMAVKGPAASVSTVLAAIAAFVMLLSENCRVPFDDPETHLELTMIHEAMILDNSGPDLAFILYAASFKLWTFSAFLVWLCGLCGLAALPAVLAVGVLVGTVESSVARMRFTKTPFVLACAFALAVLALVLEVLH